MSFKSVLLILIVIVNGIFAITLIKDLLKHKAEVIKEPASTTLLPFTSAVMFFFSALGVSDFAISTSLYPKLKWVDIKKLPGTLNTQCTIPVAFMALAYIKNIEVGVLTLVVCIVSQVIGSYFGSRFVVKLPAKKIKLGIGTGMLIAALIIVLAQFNLLPAGGDATSLSPIKLIIAAALLMIYGALNNIGIGSYALTTITVYLLGLNPAVAFPIMMGSSTFSVPVGSMQFVKSGEYSRKITLFTSIFGVIGVFFAVKLVTSLDLTLIQWLVAAILLYSAYGMLKPSKN